MTQYFGSPSKTTSNIFSSPHSNFGREITKPIYGNRKLFYDILDEFNDISYNNDDVDCKYVKNYLDKDSKNLYVTKKDLYDFNKNYEFYDDNYGRGSKEYIIKVRSRNNSTIPIIEDIIDMNIHLSFHELYDMKKSRSSPVPNYQIKQLHIKIRDITLINFTRSGPNKNLDIIELEEKTYKNKIRRLYDLLFTEIGGDSKKIYYLMSLIFMITNQLCEFVFFCKEKIEERRKKSARKLFAKEISEKHKKYDEIRNFIKNNIIKEIDDLRELLSNEEVRTDLIKKLMSNIQEKKEIIRHELLLANNKQLENLIGIGIRKIEEIKNEYNKFIESNPENRNNENNENLPRIRPRNNNIDASPKIARKNNN